MDSRDLAARIEGELGPVSDRDRGAPVVPSSSAPPRIADHELDRLIGSGSYGDVWLARGVTGRWRAIKIVSRARFSSDRPYEREFRGLLRFEPVSRAHSGLVQVLHVGRDDAAGAFYYVMELADGMDVPGANGSTGLAPFSPATYAARTLRAELESRGRLPVTEAITLGVELSGALGHLHRHGLVHRDVKPSNVIFVQGQPKLADLGLVTSAGEARSFVGTEGFIPPEGPGTEKADLFALGRLLYEAVTGKDRCEFPELPSDLDTWPDRATFLEFNEILTRLGAPDPARRYANAAEVAGDLNLILAGRSVRQAHGTERRLAQARRIILAAVLGLALTLGLAWIQQERQHRAEARAARERSLRERAEDAERDGRRQLQIALLEQARALVLSRELGHRTRALAALQQTGGATQRAALRQIAVAALSVPDLRLDREIPVAAGTTLVQPSRTFDRVAVATGTGPVTIRSLPDFEVRHVLAAGSTNPAWVAAWNREGTGLAVKRQRDGAGARADWEFWSLVPAPRLVATVTDIARNAVAYHPTRPRLLTAHPRGRVTERDAASGRVEREFQLADTVHALAYSPDGRRIAAMHRAGRGWQLAFLDGESLEVLHAMEWAEACSALHWHPDGRWITVAAEEASEHARGVYLIDSHNGAVTRLGEHRIKTATSVFTGDGRYLFSSGWDREIICWDLRTGQRMFTHAGTGYRQYWSGDGNQCIVWLPENRLQLFALERPVCRTLPGTPGDTLREGQFSPDGRWLVARDDRHLALWDLPGGGEPLVLSVPKRCTPFFSPDSRTLFAVPEEYSQRGYLGCWQVTAGTPAGASDAPPPRVDARPLSPPAGILRATVAGADLAVTSTDGVRFLALTNLDRAAGLPVRIPPGLGHASPDARWMAMVYEYSPWVRLYRLPGLEETARLKAGNLVTFVTFSPDGEELLVLHRGGVEWYDTGTGRLTRRLPGAPVSGSYAFYTPDGRGIWMVTHFRNAALLDRRTLEPLLPLPNNVLPVAVSPEGNRLAVSVEGRRLQIWDVPELRHELGRLGLDW